MPIEESFLLGAVSVWGSPRVRAGLRLSFWGRQIREGGSLGVGMGTGAAVGTGGLLPFVRLVARVLHRLSEELLRPDWLLASLRRSCPSR